VVDIIYKLATWDEHNTHYIALSTAEFKAIESAKGNLLEVLFIEEKMDIAIENYLELESELLASGARRMIQRDFRYISAQTERNLFSRRVVNLLTTCKGYLDQTPHHINNIYGAESSIVAEFKRHTNDQYDSRIGYRVTQALRNYVQHRGVPLHSIMHENQTVESRGERRLAVATRLLIHITKLAEDEKFKKAVLDELRNQGNEHDLLPFVRDYVAGLSVIHTKLRDALKPNVVIWEGTINDTIYRYRQAFPDQAAQGGPIFALEAEKYGCRQTTQKPVKYLNRRTWPFHRLLRSFVTNEILQSK